MKKIYMRAGMAPQDNCSALEIQKINKIGENNGNLLYQYAVARTLCVEGVELEVNNYTYNLEDAERINKECSCYIIPLADAFRETFVEELRKITNLVKLLTIPCVVIGVGLRANIDADVKEGFIFDEDVKNFMNAVLEKSEQVGVRGQMTADYLTSLGFIEGKDHRVIGCPSMYTFGSELDIKEVNNITHKSKVAFNASQMTTVGVNEFIFKNAKKFDECYFVPQLKKELLIMYGGKRYEHNAGDCYPSTLEDDVYKNGQAKFFLNVLKWYEALSEVDFVFGSRLHGNIAGILGGTPSLLITTDARTKELAEFHGLPSVSFLEIESGKDIIDIVKDIDFSSVQNKQEVNFMNFIDFLNTNKLQHIYSENINCKTAPFDNVMSKVVLRDAVLPISVCKTDEMIKRITEIADWDKEVIKNKQNKIKKQAINISALKEKNKNLTKTKKELKNENKILKNECKILKTQNAKIRKNIGYRLTNKIKRIVRGLFKINA